jgi:hypothetical protein
MAAGVIPRVGYPAGRVVTSASPDTSLAREGTVVDSVRPPVRPPVLRCSPFPTPEHAAGRKLLSTSSTKAMPRREGPGVLIFDGVGRCGSAGTKFNCRKEDVPEDAYLGIRVFRFYFKCTRCSAELAMKTDPKNSDYVMEAGASRNFEPWRDKSQQVCASYTVLRHRVCIFTKAPVSLSRRAGALESSPVTQRPLTPSLSLSPRRTTTQSSTRSSRSLRVPALRCRIALKGDRAPHGREAAFSRSDWV